MLGKKKDEIKIILKAHKVQKFDRFSFKLALPVGTTDKGIEALSAYIGTKFHKIRELSLSFATDVNAKGFFALLKLLPKLRRIQILNLRFNSFVNVSLDSISKLGLVIGKNLTHLTNLHIHFEWSSISDLCFRGFVYHLQSRLPKLKSLKLWFGFNKISSFGIAAMQKYMFKRLFNLDRLYLIFDSFRQLSPIAFQRLEKCFRLNLGNLKHLVLYFRSFEGQAVDSSVKRFISTIAKYLLSLRHLSLTFRECQLTDQGISDLAQALVGGGLTQLKELSIDLYGCSKITNQAIRNLTIQIGNHFMNLQLISLGLASCLNLTNAAVKDISTNIIAKIPTLKHVSLDFSWFKILTRPELEALVKLCQKNLKSLKYFSLKTQNYNTKITPDAIASLKNTLRLVNRVHIE